MRQVCSGAGEPSGLRAAVTISIILTGIGLIWLGTRWSRPLLTSAARIGLAVFVLLLTPPAMARILAHLESGEYDSQRCGVSQPGALLLLMGGVYADFMHTADWSSLMPASLARLEHALNSWQIDPQRKLYVAASADEAAAVDAMLAALGLAAENIIVLDNVSNTHDSVAALATGYPSTRGETIGVVTSAFHMRRAAATMSKAGFRTCTLPTHYISTTQIPAPWVIPTRSTIAQMDLVLHEYVGLLWYRLRGYA